MLFKRIVAALSLIATLAAAPLVAQADCGAKRTKSDNQFQLWRSKLNKVTYLRQEALDLYKQGKNTAADKKTAEADQMETEAAGEEKLYDSYQADERKCQQAELAEEKAKAEEAKKAAAQQKSE